MLLLANWMRTAPTADVAATDASDADVPTSELLFTG